MGDSERYFPNPNPDYEPGFGRPDIPIPLIKQQIDELTKTIESEFPAITEYAGDGLYVGTAGVAYMYYHLSKVSTLSSLKNVYIQRGLEYIEPALEVAKEASPKYAPSFILGSAGVIAVAAALFHASGDRTASEAYITQYQNLANSCIGIDFLDCGSDELFVGRAGYVMGAIWLARETGNIIRKTDIYLLCKVILKSGQDYVTLNRHSAPLIFPYYEVEYLGAAHGLSSILQSLMACGYLQETHQDRDEIKSAIDYLLGLQTPDGNFPAATDEIGKEPKLVHWCHGAGGVFYLMAKSYLVFKEDKYLQSCKKMADLIWKKGILKKGPGLCHGVSGNAYVFLIMFRLTKEPDYLYRAMSFYEFMETDTFKSNARTPDNLYSLFEGIAGKVCFLADLTSPEKAIFPFFDIF
ncbi:hypothetical protein ABEB36_009818 [Hypothenemus hampei]